MDAAAQSSPCRARAPDREFTAEDSSPSDRPRGRSDSGSCPGIQDAVLAALGRRQHLESAFGNSHSSRDREELRRGGLAWEALKNAMVQVLPMRHLGQQDEAGHLELLLGRKILESELFGLEEIRRPHEDLVRIEAEAVRGSEVGQVGGFPQGNGSDLLAGDDVVGVLIAREMWRPAIRDYNVPTCSGPVTVRLVR